MVDPLISIIVPIYDVENYLKKCVDSLLTQTYSNIEIILVDDGSKDKSGSICDAYSEMDERVHIIHKENGGLSSARKAGIDAIKGDYAMFVDGDDWIDPETVQHCVDQIIKNEAIDCVIFSYIKEYPENSIPMHVMDRSCEMSALEAKDKVYRRLFGLLDSELQHPERMHMMESCCMKLYKSSLICQGKFFDTKEVGSSEDALFNMYALDGCRQMAYLDEPLYHYRKLSQSITNSFRPDLVKQWNYLFDIMQDIIIEKQLSDRYSEALSNRIALSIFGIGFNELARPNANARQHIKYLKQYLKSERYHKAAKRIDLKPMPITWKVFIANSRFGFAGLLYLMLQAMNVLKKKFN